jgi:hypothetical protein
MRKIVSSLACLCLSVPAVGQVAIAAANPDAEYVDRVIATNQLPTLDDENNTEPFDDSGLPRGWQIEAALGTRTDRENTQREAGVSASAYFETADYGAWSFDIDANRNIVGQNIIGRLTIFQRGMALDNGWRIDNSFGTLNNPLPSMLRQQYRFALPTAAFLGFISEINNTDGRILNAAFGRSGRRTAGRFSNFDTSGGSLITLGGQTHSGPFQTAASIVSTEDDDGISQVSAFAAAAWSVNTTTVQANILKDKNTGNGVWVDALTKPDRIEHRYGIFRFDPQLEWAGQNMQSDVQGAYYRAASRQTRWVWSGGVDHVQSVSGATPTINYYTAQGRYQLTSRWGFGGASSVRRASAGNAASTQVFFDQRTTTGSTRLQIEQSRTKELRSEQITWDQSFANIDSFQWAAKFAFMQQQDSNDRTGQEWSAAVYGSRDLGSRLRWDGSLRYANGVGALAQSSVETNLGLNWTISSAWSLSASYIQNQGRRDSVFNLDPLLILNKIDENDRSFFLTLRYEHHAGSAVGIIAGNSAGGAGNIAGEIYLDANADGRRNADEVPAVDIVVLLDGRYPARTDASGHFSFNRVAAGSHTLITVSDNLPLPWQLPSDAKTIEVKVRGTARWSIGALQPAK